MSEKKPPAPPKGLGAPGRRLWREVLAEFDLAEWELAILLEAAHTRDLLAELQATLTAEGAVLTSPAGVVKTHPSAVEVRQQRLVLARLLASLRVPDGLEGDESQGRRSQRRTGFRGQHSLRAVR